MKIERIFDDNGTLTIDEILSSITSERIDTAINELLTNLDLVTEEYIIKGVN